MKNKITILVTILIALLYAGSILFWHLYTPNINIFIQNPGADNRPEGKNRKTADVVIGEFFIRYTDNSSTLKGKWSCFRGSDYKNIVQTNEKIDFTSNFSLVWKIETGEGHAAPVIYNGLVYLLDYDEKLSSDMLRCFDLESGTELWRRWYRVPMKRNHGFSRTAPAVTDKYVITVGPNAHVMCCDRMSGELKWNLDMQKHFETEVPFWYSGQCPRMEDNQLILSPAGKEILMAGLDCETGEVVWQTPNTMGYKMSHSSIMPMILLGKKTFVYAGIGGVCGISAETADKGKLLWSVDTWKPSVIAPSPLQLSSDKIVLTAGYGAGGALLQVKYADGKWSAIISDKYKPNEGLSSEQQTPILYEQMVITVPPKDGGGIRGKLVAYVPNNLRTPIWESAADERFGLGPYLIIENHLFALKDDGELYVYKLEQKKFTLIKKQHIMDGIDAWGPMAYADGYLLLRDNQCVYALKIGLYSLTGTTIEEWQACSDNSDYCALTTSEEYIFVTDAENKHIVQYDKQGKLVRFINSPQGFIIPSYSFDIINIHDTIYCSNSGRHQIESYTLDGEFIASFGKSGTGVGAFSGCCNPVFLAQSSDGNILTSEKGNPRISSYETDGKFHSVLFDAKTLGGGTAAYKLKVSKKNIYVANGKTVSVY